MLNFSGQESLVKHVFPLRFRSFLHLQISYGCKGAFEVNFRAFSKHIITVCLFIYFISNLF